MAASVPYSATISMGVGFDAAPKPALYDDVRAEADAALRELIEAREPIELLANIGRDDDLAAASDIVARFRDESSDIFILGIGGSSLGGQALADLLPFGGRQSPRLRFLDNPDPTTFAAALKNCEHKTTRFVAISKSGGTAETLAQALVAAETMRAAVGDNQLGRHFLVVTEPKPSALRRFAEMIGCPVLDHPIGIGGRYSVLSIVGLLPAMLMGLDARAIRTGAAQGLDAMRAGDLGDASPATGAALHVALIRAGHLRETVLWAYADSLRTFGAWWRQLWAESLGKGGGGTTPVAALGPVDQHSQLQLFLDGPGGTLFTLITTDTSGKGPLIPKKAAEELGISYLGGRRMGDLVAAEAQATAETLVRRGRPVRIIRLGIVDEQAMGALLLHFMVETILTGHLMGVNPFDQPAVEEGKILARTYLEDHKSLGKRES